MERRHLYSTCCCAWLSPVLCLSCGLCVCGLSLCACLYACENLQRNRVVHLTCKNTSHQCTGCRCNHIVIIPLVNNIDIPFSMALTDLWSLLIRFTYIHMHTTIDDSIYLQWNPTKIWRQWYQPSKKNSQKINCKTHSWSSPAGSLLSSQV